MNTNLATFHDFSAIDNALLSDTTKKQYKKALFNYLETGNKLADVKALEDYVLTLKTSSRAFLKAAIKLVSREYVTALKSGANSENILDVQASLYRIEALNETIKVSSTKGVKAHTWLSQKQVKDLMATCKDDLEGMRDWIVLGLMVGAGLRREELVSLRFEDVKEQPQKGGKMRVVLAVKGKGAKDRTIPISDALANKIKIWGGKIGAKGFIVRSLGRKKIIGNSLSVIGAFDVVRKHGAMIGKPELDPHDLRRTYAQLGYDAGIPITQISKLLGHSDIATTQRYLNLDLDLEHTASDFIPLE